MKRTAALLAALALAGCGGDAVEGDLAVTADRLFDGRDVVEDAVVVVRGDEIVAAGPRASLEYEAERTLALGDATLLPGIVDLHVHGLGSGQRLSPVTTVRDLGASEAGAAAHESEAGAPRVVFAGPLVTVPGGYPIPTWGEEIAGVARDVEEAREVVRRLAGAGAGVIKISLERGPGDWPILSRAQVEAIVDEAHAHDLRVTAHVSEMEVARLAFEAGVDELAHMPCRGDDDALWGELAEAGVEIVGTLHVVGGFCEVGGYAKAFVRAGGTLLYGSDFGNPGIPNGLDVEELRLMVQAGLSPREALTNATSRAGEQLPVDGLGTLREGAPADLFAVRGDPLADLDRLDDPVFLLVRGEVVIEGGQLRTPTG